MRTSNSEEDAFSETLRYVFEILASNTPSKKVNKSAIQAFLRWGHGSGKDHW
jgi:hypothetical protein